MNRLAKAMLGISLIGMSAGAILSRKPDLESYATIAPRIDYSAERQAQRKVIVVNAERLLGRPEFSQENPDSVSCIDVFVRSACGLEERLKDDYNHLAHPEKRYASIDLRVPVYVANAKAIFGNDFQNTPDNPFFTRRIQNVLRYQQANGLFFKPEEQTPRPGMIVYWRRLINDFPTHAGVVAKTNGNEITEVIHASTSKGEVVRCPAQTIADAGYAVYGFGDAPK